MNIHPSKCPVCGLVTTYIYSIEHGEGGDISTWFRCNCGVIFQNELPDGKVYDKNYIKEFMLPSVVKRSITACTTYAPLIEKLTYGRELLDVGFCTKTNMNEFERRGWLTYGIDSNKHICGHDNIYKGDFLDYDFNIKMDKKVIEENTGTTVLSDRTFDLIWMNDVLECFKEPLKGLTKAVDLLSESGVLYISTPDTDFISKTGVPAFPHWRKSENYVMWNERSLKRELEKLGLQIIMCRRNFHTCFHSFYNLHIIAQKIYY